MKKLAIITSHPIQYNAPLFRLLHERRKVEVKVFYTWGQTENGFVYDPDFKREFKWDIPLLDGYEKEFVENISTSPGAGHFKGIKNKDLQQRIDQYNPDSLLVFGWSFQSHLQVLRHYKGKKKILFRGDSTLLDETPGVSVKKILRRIFLKWVYKHVDVALFTGAANKAYYMAHALREHQLVYAPHAIDNDRFDDTHGHYEEKASMWRKELGIASTELVFLFAGKLEAKKDPGLLIEAFSAITELNIRLIIVGNGVLEQEIKQKAQADQRIIFLDFQNQQQMPVVYRLADVFVLPSQGPGETWGLSVNEAMACKRPVVVSDRCGCADDLVKENGVIFEAGKKESLKKALCFFIEQRQLAEEMGERSVQTIKQFSYNQVAAAIEQTI
ncbi:MAG TPA: glycosyltransferase family 4 protein [Lacibacter sp.]|nr:glycosyltransferase family 4 protein [Lacibacter sp.]